MDRDTILQKDYNKSRLTEWNVFIKEVEMDSKRYSRRSFQHPSWLVRVQSEMDAFLVKWGQQFIIL